MEPYRIKVVESLIHVSKKVRKGFLTKAGYNPFFIPAHSVTIDLISDSGTGAMSSAQWAAMMQAREDFSGQKAYYDFIQVAQNITGFPYIQPVHQGRMAEHLLFTLLLRPGEHALSNCHFLTTRENIKSLGCQAIDISKPELPFCGNVDLDKLATYLRQTKKIKMVILTITSNNMGGQPVSLDNIKKARHITKKHKVLLLLDACRFADNAYLIKHYTKSKQNIKTLCLKIFGLCDIVYLSNKKDGLVNIGGFIGVRDKRLFDQLQLEILKQESYPTSGGLAARDMAAMTIGLQESLDEDFLRAHNNNIQYLAAILKKQNVNIFEPVGGHGVVIFPKQRFHYAAFSLAAELYLRFGIRAGVFGKSVRLAIPRRVYTKDHLFYVGESMGKIYHEKLPKLKLVNRPTSFFNFCARFKKK